MYRALAIATITASIVILGLYAVTTLDASFSLDRIFHHISLPHYPMAQTDPYKAPLVNEDLPESDKVAGSFAVFLRPGVSLENHKSALGETIDLDAHIQNVFPYEMHGQVVYGAKDISDAALDAIRADARVVMVECGAVVRIPEDDMGGGPV